MADVTATFDKPVYNPGDLMTLTVTYPSGAATAQDVHVEVTVGSYAPVEVDATVGGISVTDPDRTWTQASLGDTQATFTATA